MPVRAPCAGQHHHQRVSTQEHKPAAGAGKHPQHVDRLHRANDGVAPPSWRGHAIATCRWLHAVHCGRSSVRCPALLSHSRRRLEPLIEVAAMCGCSYRGYVCARLIASLQKRL
eukprot:43251-Chlamydomonas_euryale.AAC.10